MRLGGRADARGMNWAEPVRTASRTSQSALAAFRGHHLQGYAIRNSVDGWICVVTTGLSWSKMNCRTLDDARCLFRTMTHASRFEIYRDIDELNDLIDTMPPYQKPGILPEQLSGIPAKLPRLNRA